MIRWPLVSRARYNDLRAESFAHFKQWQAWELKHADTVREDATRYDELLAKYHALRVQGASEPLPPAPKATPDVVTQAIIAKAKSSILLRKHYAEYVRQQRAVGVSEEEIAQAILEGHSDDNEGVA